MLKRDDWMGDAMGHGLFASKRPDPAEQQQQEQASEIKQKLMEGISGLITRGDE